MRFNFGKESSRATDSVEKPMVLNRATALRKIFPGWWLVLTGGFLALWGFGYQAYGFSALFKPISQELGLSRTATTIPASIGRMEGGILAPIAGWLTDRFGPRWLIFLGAVMVAICFSLMSLVHSFWAFLVVWGVFLPIGIDLALGVPLQAAIARWFVKKRGLASGVQVFFSGLSGVLVLPLVAWLITVVGWRMTVLIGGIVMLVIGVPLVSLFVRQYPPERYGMLPDGASVEDVEGEDMAEKGRKYAAEVSEFDFTLSQVLKTPTYWLLLISAACHNLAAPVINIHSVPFLTDRGVDPVRAAQMLSLMVTVSIPGRFLGAYLVDRMKKQHLNLLIFGAYSLQALGFGSFLLHQTEAMIYTWYILYGFGFGLGFGLMMPVRVRYFGRKAIGSIMGIGTAISLPVGIIAPIWAGWVFDRTGSYMVALEVVAALLTFGSLVALFIRPPKVLQHQELAAA
jgi:sugar phosphate permease